MRVRGLGLLMAALAVIGAVACTQNSTTPSPVTETETFAGQPINTPAETPAVTPAPSCNEGEQATLFVRVVTFDLQHGTASVVNGGTCPHSAGLALYDLRDGIMKQYFVAEDFKEVPAGATAKFAVKIPESVCRYQLDLLAGVSEAEKTDGTFPDQGRNLIDTDAYGGNFGENPACRSPKDPPTPPPPPPPACSGVGTPTFSFDKNEGETTAGVKSILTFSAGFTGSVALAPAPISGFPGGVVASGAPNTSTYNRPGVGQQSFTVTGTWEVRKGEELCASNSATVSITPLSPPPPPPPPTCVVINLNGTANVSGTSATITATWNGSGSTTVKLDNGTAQPISNGPPGVAYPGLSSGSHTAYLHYSQAGASCDKSVPFTIQEPPPPPRTCNDIHVVMQNPQVSGTSATCMGTWNAPPSSGTMFLDNGTPRTVASGAGTTYTGLSAGAHTCKLDVLNGTETCSASKSFTIEPPPPPHCTLTISKGVNAASAGVGDTLTYRLEFSNTGTGNCTGGGVKVEDDVPSGTSYVTQRHSGNGSFEGNNNGTLSWNYGTLTPGESGWVEFDAKVDDHACGTWQVRNKGRTSAAELNWQWVYSNQVTTTITKECPPPGCPPNQTTSNVRWENMLESQYGNNPKCSDFGLQKLHKQESFPNPNSWETDREVSMVIVKDGTCGTDANRYFAKKVTPNPNTKWIAAGLHVDFLCEATGQYKNLSHVELCGCPIGTAR